MIENIPRLLELWGIAARYRLDTLLPEDQWPKQAKPLRRLIALHPLASRGRSQDPRRLKHALEAMGPLAVKMGQLLSTRRDLIPPELLDQLTALQDRVSPFDSRLAMTRIEQALGAPVTSLFARFDLVPLAAASIAQVHTAALSDGREVVVKVTRPGIDQQIVRDFEVLRSVARWLESRHEAARALHLMTVIEDYRRVILDELDLTVEASNTMQMRRNFEGSRLMYVPEVYQATPTVMVAERITGVPISDIATFERLGMDRAYLAETGLTIFFTQLLRDNFFHADMHPGNVFVETLNPQMPRFIALDCAIVGELSEQDRFAVARMLLAVMQSNFNQLITIIHHAGWIPPGTDRHALARDMRRVVGPMISKPMDQMDFAGILVGVMDIARRYRLEIPPQLMLLIKTLVHVEGLGRDLYPQLDIWNLAKPMLSEWVSDRMQPARVLQDFRQQLPDMLMGMTDLPNLLTDSLHGLRQQTEWQSRQLRQIQTLHDDLLQARRLDWLTVAALLPVGYIIYAVGWMAALPLLVVVMLIILWRVVL